MNCDDTRSKESAGGAHSVTSACCQRDALGRVDIERSRQLDSPGRDATDEMSTAVTRQPRSASHIASAPSPAPMSNAAPDRRSATSATSCGFGLPLQTADADP